MSDRYQPRNLTEWHITRAVQRYWDVCADMFANLQLKHGGDVGLSTKFLGERVFAEERSKALQKQIDQGPADAGR